MDDTKAAAERRQQHNAGRAPQSPYWYSYNGDTGFTQQHDDDAEVLADAYLAELDPTPVDRAFAESLGWFGTQGNCVEWWQGPTVVELKLSTLCGFEKWSLRMNGEDIIDNPTRGTVRTLLRLMEGM